MNKNIYLISLLALGALSLNSCSSSDEPSPNPTPDNTGLVLGIKTTVSMNTKTALIKELGDGNEMNTFVTLADQYGAEQPTEAIRATHTGGAWKMEKNVGLSAGYTAEVIAAYPYVDGVTNYRQYPIDVTSQVDVLYSGLGAYASSTQTTASLNMKHAMSLLSVNIKKQGYTGEGLITSIRVEHPQLIATKGHLNAATGDSEKTEFGPVQAAVEGTITEDGIKGALPGLWVIPFSSKDHEAVKAVITIDGKDYNVSLPEVSMATGWQYAFQGVLTANGLAFLPNATEEYQLDMTDNEFYELEGFGAVVFTFTGSEFSLPTFTGVNVFGNVKAEDGTSAEYAVGSTVKLKSAARQTITVETWNSSGFELNSIDGIDVIDLSRYN